MIEQVSPKASHAAQFLISPENGTRPVLLRVSALNCGAVRVTRTERGAFLPDHAFAVVSRETGTCHVTEEENDFLTDCGDIRVQVRKDTGALTFLDRAGRTLLK